MSDAPEPRRDRCETCRFWQSDAQHTLRDRDGNLKRLGDCRVKPPTVMMLDGALRSVWARTRAEHFCGQWQRRKETGA